MYDEYSQMHADFFGDDPSSLYSGDPVSPVEDEVNEIQLLEEIEKIPLAQIQSDIESLERMVKQLKTVFELEQVQDDPFVEIEYKDVVALYNKIKSMLDDYYRYTILFRRGCLLFKSDNIVIPANTWDAGIEEHAPAYKHNIDNGEIYRLWKKGTSIRKIAKQVGCSPDTVKRRIYSMEHGFKNK